MKTPVLNAADCDVVRLALALNRTGGISGQVAFTLHAIFFSLLESRFFLKR